MYQSLDKLENSKFDGEPVPPPLNLLLPRLIPKEPPIKLASNSYPRVNSFISRKRNKSKAKEESKSKKNIFNSQNNTQYDNYFIDKLQENITNFKKYLYNTSSKCFICGKPGHHSTECKEKEDEICPKCLQKNHFNQICPNEICVNCGKRGHNQQNCFYTSGNKNKKNLKKCKNCHNYGHESFECLCKPNPIHIKNYSKIPLCVFCGNPNHYICPFNKNKNIFIIPDHYDDSGNNLNLYEYNSNKIINRNSWESLLNFFNNQCKITGKIELNLGEVSDNLLKEDIQNTYFCCKCGGNHLSDNCGKNKNKKINFNDLDDSFIFNLKDNFIHQKNPLKFEPYLRKEYTINHHDIRTDYYDQSDSSGESFDSIFNKKK